MVDVVIGITDTEGFSSFGTEVLAGA